MSQKSVLSYIRFLYLLALRDYLYSSQIIEVVSKRLPILQRFLFLLFQREFTSL